MGEHLNLSQQDVSGRSGTLIHIVDVIGVKLEELTRG
ncbi:hypothetical protein KE639_03128 [Streptomyces sp. V17-9]|nr:hypothetical protein KE639_03128 [Streptomyces sp. V17-9]